MSFDNFDEKESVRERIDIVELVSQSLEVRRQGRGFVALCPWHDDSKPSLQINPQRQSWKCWVCDIGGDVFNFVMRRENVGFREALEMLAEQAGVTLTRGGGPQPTGPTAKRGLLGAMAWAEALYHRCLLRGAVAEPGRDYLRQRGVLPAMIDRFRLGFAPNQWQWLCDQAAKEGVSYESLEAVGLIARNQAGGYYDVFRGRVLFPIRDVMGRAIALGGRILPELADDKNAKYINTRETRLFSKSENLYGLDLVKNANRRDGKILVMEGYTDVVAAHQQGVDEAVAVLGTALGPRHVRLLRRFTDQVMLVLDGDEAGQRRTNEVLELFVAENMDLRVLTLPQGLDPCDFLLQQGADAFRELESTALSAMDHKIKTATAGVDLANDPHRSAAALEEILTIVAKAVSSQTLATSAQRLREENLLGYLARRFRVETTWLRQRLTELRRGQSRNRREQTAAAGAGVAIETQRIKLRPADQELIQILLQAPECVALAAQRISGERLEDGPAREIYDMLLHLHQRGVTPGFSQVMTLVEEPRFKNLLVELDELSAQQSESAIEDAPRRLERLIEKYNQDDLRLSSKKTCSELEQTPINDQQEVVLTLQELIEIQRTRQGLNRPKEG